MAYQLETTIMRWNGADGDHMDITEAPEGSTFHAVDIGKRYIFHNGGWVEDLRDIYAIQQAAI